MRIVLATKNPGKLKEFSQLAGDTDWLDLELAPDDYQAEETGDTFMENAEIKARQAAKLTAMISVADDSGICVEALDGRPGVHSSRYCDGDEALGRTKLLAELAAVPADRRGATYVCSMVVCGADGAVLFSTEALWSGQIGFAEKGANGFGFDPIFYLPDCQLTAAELSPGEKNSVSHRGKAWRLVLKYLATMVATKAI
jgi:XTP/dITP diphosphohydrolase